MEYTKFYEIDSQNRSFEKKRYRVFSNPTNVNLEFCRETEKLRINDKFYYITFDGCIYADCKIYSITDDYHILSYYNISECSYEFYLITIKNGDATFENHKGDILYITKTGFIANVYWEGAEIIDGIHYDDETHYMYYDVISKSYTRIFKSFEHESTGIKYFIIRLDKKREKFIFYVILDLWLQDIQRQNPKISVEKYYNMKENNSSQDFNKKFVDVNFKDLSVCISSEKLKELKSDFINEQLKENIIYLESFTYEEYQNQTREFLDYISSYKLHLYLKNVMHDKLISMLN